jgi:hypothetical protein
MTKKQSPVAELLTQLSPHLHAHQAAMDMFHKWYGEGLQEEREKAARTRILIEEIKIEDIIRTWVENQPPRSGEVTNGTAEPSA